MIEIRPLKAEDILQVIETGVKEFSLKADRNPEFEKLAEEREKSGFCVTGLVDGKIIGCGGIDKIWEGVGEVWLILTYDVDKRSKEVWQCIKDGFERLSKGFKRVQGYGRMDFPQAHIVFKHLGFDVEGKMRKFSPDGCDCILYAKIKEE